MRDSIIGKRHFCYFLPGTAIAILFNVYKGFLHFCVLPRLAIFCPENLNQYQIVVSDFP